MLKSRVSCNPVAVSGGSSISNSNNNNGSTTTTTTRCISRIRKRPVSFGNPALGTYHGFVYTLDNEQASTIRQRPLIEGAVEAQRLVAMVDVPPEQVPEGILNLTRPHRPWIDHVRIVIAEEEIDSSNNKKNDLIQDGGNINNYSTTSPATTTVEAAASILADEEERITKDVLSSSFAAVQQHNNDNNHRDRRYLVLIELCTDDAANELVNEIHGQPYTSLDETVICYVHHVIALQGIDGVSLMSPFFAPPTTSATAKLTGTTDSNSSKDVTTSTTTHHSLHNSAEEHFNCAVCLEHMDLDHSTNNTTTTTITATSQQQQQERTSLLTTVCNHSFHLDCLMQWQDSPCPVCRYDHSGLNEALSQCHTCGSTHNNYVCLICGIVSCSNEPESAGISSTMSGTVTTDSVARYPPQNSNSTCRSNDNDVHLVDSSSSSVASLQMQQQHQNNNNYNNISLHSHARKHYDETLHAYALNTETQHVWDFAGQGYVHRLLQNKDDGKLVEVNDPLNTTSQERTLDPGLSVAQEGEVVHRKLEGFASQYYTLLKSQLEQQRIYYEGRVEEIRREFNNNNNKTVKKTKTDLITALKQERNQLSQRLITLKTKCKKVEEDVIFIKNLNESLESNRRPLKLQIEEAQQQRYEQRKMFDECVPALQEKVTMLMLQLENPTINISSNNEATIGKSNSSTEEYNKNRKPAAR